MNFNSENETNTNNKEVNMNENAKQVIISENETNTNNNETNTNNKEVNMNENAKQVIVDYVNRIKYEVTERQLAELAGCATPLSEEEFVDWHAKIDELDLSRCGEWSKGEVAAQLRSILHRVLDVTRMVSGKVVRIGKRIVKWIFSLLDRYPSTVAAALVMAALAFIAAHIPVLRYVLLPIVQCVAVGLVGLIFILECVRGVDVAVANK